MPFPLFVLASLAIASATIAATILLSRWRWLAIIAALTGATVLLLFHGPVYFRHFPLDDAYIMLRYSKHLAEGLGPNWNSEGRVEGYTSFLWVAVVAGIGKLGLDIVDGARVLGLFSFAATFFFVFRIWKLWADENEGSGLDSPVLLATALLALAITDGVAFWGFSGMETPLIMALLTGGAYLYFRERRGGRYPWSAIAFAAAAMARPEAIIAAGVTGAFTLTDVANSSDRHRASFRAFSWASVFLMLYGSYFLWRYNYYGYLFPNTFYAKVGPTSAVFERGFDYVFAGALNYHLLPMFAGIIILLAMPRLRRDAAYLLVLGSAMLAGVAFEGGDTFGHGRFIAPLLPLFYLGGLAGFATLLKRLPFEPAQGALVATVILSFGGLMLLRGSNNPFLPEDRANHEERQLLGIWLSENTPPHYTIAAFAIGSISYHSDRDMLDLLGLNDVVIAHTDVSDFGMGIARHEKYNVDYALDEVRPEIIITGDGDPGPLSTEEFREQQTGPRGLPAKIALMTDPRLWNRYEVRSLNLEGRWFNFLQRKDTVAELQAPGLR